jgi:hypothetical protein
MLSARPLKGMDQRRFTPGQSPGRDAPTELRLDDQAGERLRECEVVAAELVRLGRQRVAGEAVRRPHHFPRRSYGSETVS